MGSFFTPLRRKIGVVTLSLACLFTAGWIRSEYRYDWLRLTGRKTSWRFGSQENVISFYLVRRPGENDEFRDPFVDGDTGDALDLYEGRIRTPPRSTILMDSPSCGVGRGKDSNSVKGLIIRNT